MSSNPSQSPEENASESHDSMRRTDAFPSHTFGYFWYRDIDLEMNYTLSTSVVVLEESPCPRGSLRTNFQVLVLVIVLGSSSPRKFSRTE